MRSPIIRSIRQLPGIHDLVVLNSGIVLVFYDKIYRLCPPDQAAEPVFALSKHGMTPPLIGGVCVTPWDDIYWGEYNCRPGKHAIAILRGSDGGTNWDVAHVFPPGKVRHIHSLRYDPYRQQLLICTGDANHEAGIWSWNPHSGQPHCIGCGDQGWRAVSVIPTSDFLIWGTDAGMNNPEGPRNYIYTYDIASGARNRICEIDNPAYFSTILGNGIYVLTTTYEGQSGNPRSAGIWASADGFDWQRIAALGFGRRRGSSSRFGLIRIPGGEPISNALHFTPINAKGHFTIQCISVDHIAPQPPRVEEPSNTERSVNGNQ